MEAGTKEEEKGQKTEQKQLKDSKRAASSWLACPKERARIEVTARAAAEEEASKVAFSSRLVCMYRAEESEREERGRGPPLFVDPFARLLAGELAHHRLADHA